MTDRVTKEKRSWMMSRVKGRDTAPERAVRTVLHKMGFRFRLHDKKLPGKPDLIFPARCKVIFVHGCFWHGHSCGRGALPSTNRAFWKEKISANKSRDKHNRIALTNAGWDSLVVWECEVRSDTNLADRMASFLRADSQPARRRRRASS
jgi:DNA mismatch endonuclease, patch repair protein